MNLPFCYFRVNIINIGKNMLFSHGNGQTSAYKNTQIESNASVSNSFELILLLHDKLIEHLDTLLDSIAQNDLATKQVLVGKIIEILSALDASLDLSIENDLIQNIHNLYMFSITKITEVSVSKSVEDIEGVRQVILDLRDGWGGMIEHL